MTRRDDLLRALEGISRTEAYDAEARRILELSTHPTVLLCRAEQIEAAYQRIACSYDPETERYLVCDGHHRCLCRRDDESPSPGEQLTKGLVLCPPGCGDSDLRAYALLLARVQGGKL